MTVINTEQILYNDSLELVMENYIEDSISKKGIEIGIYKTRLRKLRFEEATIEDIIDDLNNEVEKEELARLEAGNTKKIIVGGIVLTVALMVITILAALGILFKGNIVSVFLIGSVVASLISVFKGFDELKAKKRRKEVRKIFWKGRY